MKYFVTGASGFIGEKLVLALADRGERVTALFRSKCPEGFKGRPLIRPIQGDITSAELLSKQMQGHDYIFHVAAYAQPWAKNPATYEDINVTGTLNVVHAAVHTGAKRVLLTATAGVFGPERGRALVNETFQPESFLTHYERTKASAVKKAFALETRKTEILAVSPSRVYGPGTMSTSNAVTKMIRLYDRGLLRFIPGNGKSVGNYVFVDDVVEGHLLAMEKGRNRHNYLLGGENASFDGFFAKLASVSGKKHRMFHLPLPVMMGAAFAMDASSRAFGTKPLITPPWVKRYMLNWGADISKSKNELGYWPISLEDGISKTLSQLRT